MTKSLPYLSVVATGICGVLVSVLVWGWLTDGLAEYRRLLLALASTAYLLVAAGLRADRSNYGRLVLAGLAFCWLGDVLGPGNFLLGAAMFLIAHLFFVPAFWMEAASSKAVLIAVAFALCLTGIVLYVLWPRIGPDAQPLMAAYGGVIALMLGAAWSTVGRQGRVLIPLGASIFYVSDLFLAQTAFLDGGRIWTVTGYPLYYTACLLLAWSIRETTRDGHA